MGAAADATEEALRLKRRDMPAEPPGGREGAILLARDEARLTPSQRQFSAGHKVR